MNKFGKEKRDELVTWCMIINTLLAVLSVILQVFNTPAEPSPKTPIPKNHQLIK